jgi:hypothetical protein
MSVATPHIKSCKFGTWASTLFPTINFGFLVCVNFDASDSPKKSISVGMPFFIAT